MGSLIPEPILESGGKGWLLDEDEWLRRHTVIESGLEETSLFGFVGLFFGWFWRFVFFLIRVAFLLSSVWLSDF